MHQIAKITPADYPELLAAADAGTPQRELARRYDCAPSLVARHQARAKRERELSEPTPAGDPGATAEPHNGSLREILEARIRDPRTAARDLASLTNALARLEVEQQGAGQPSIYTLRPGTLILEPESGPGPEHSWRLMLRVRGGIEHSADGLTNRQAWFLAGCGMGPRHARRPRLLDRARAVTLRLTTLGRAGPVPRGRERQLSVGPSAA
jgi:hypothetical protein